jgi:four helix bundle protein
MKDFRDLKVWLAAHQLALVVYKATSGFPREKTYGLVSQLRRAEC